MGMTYTEPVTIGNAVDNLVLWTTNVMRSVDLIQWKQVGYMQMEDGSVDYARPMHTIANPNVVLHEVASQFSQHVKASLMYLTTVADAQGGEGGDAENGMYSLDNNGETVPLSGSDNNMTMSSRKRSISSISMIGNETLGGTGGSAPIRVGRENSFGSLIQAPKLAREHSLMGFPLALPGGMPSTDSIGTPVILKGLSASMDAGDGSVFYILAKSFNSSVGEVGVPAFDQGKDLIGVYTEGQDFEKVTQPIFKPLAQLRQTISKKDIQKASDLLSKAIADNDPAVHSLAMWNNNLETMKEDALIYNMLNVNMEIAIGQS
jgi:hypothetical protein